MYFLLDLLDDCGYMARATVVLDPIFKKVGLSGKSVIPFIVGTGCAVPGVMASRTIRDERERRATAMLAPFMPCGAKLPIIAAFAGAFFKGSSWVGPLMYFMGIVIILIGALLVRGITGHKKKSFFIIELPEYKAPSVWGAVKSMCQRGWSFVVKAATIIMLCNTAVQVMQSFTWSFKVAENANDSILASIGGPFAYLLVPVIGFHAWQMAAAAITGFIAKENVVGTLAVCFAISDVATELPGACPELTTVAALAYLMFNLFTPPCFAAIGAMNSEMKSAKWLWGGIGLQIAVGYTVGYLVYTVGTLIVSPASLAVTPAIIGGCAVVVFVGIIAALIVKARKKV
jgi:ferrous iron transport protein B